MPQYNFKPKSITFNRTIIFIYLMIVALNSTAQVGFEKQLPLERLSLDTPVTTEPFKDFYAEGVNEKDPSKSIKVYSFDVNSNGKIKAETQYSFIDEKIRGVTIYKYDPSNRIIESAFYPNSGLMGTTKTLYFYDTNGKVLKKEDFELRDVGLEEAEFKWRQTMLYAYEYDKSGKLDKSTETDDMHTKRWTIYSYDKTDRIKQTKEYRAQLDESGKVLFDTVVAINDYEYKPDGYKIMRKSWDMLRNDFNKYTERNFKLNSNGQIIETSISVQNHIYYKMPEPPNPETKYDVELFMIWSVYKYDGLGRISSIEKHTSMNSSVGKLLFHYKDNTIINFEERQF